MLFKTILVGALLTYTGLAASVSKPQNSEIDLANRDDDFAFNTNVSDVGDLHRRHHKIPKCSKKTKGTCIVHRHGNIKVEFSGKRVNYGTYNPLEAIDHLHHKCRIGGCPKTSFKKRTKIVYKGNMIPAHVVFSGFAAFDGTNRDQLFEALKVAVKKTLKKSREEGDANGTEKFFEQYRHSSLFEVAIPVHGEGKTDPNIQLSIKIEEHNGAEDGFCSDFFSVAGAIAGAINGIAGAGFSLLALVCA